MQPPPDKDTQAAMAAVRAELDLLKQEATKRARRSKRKGARGEVTVAKLAQAHGFQECRRNFGSGARGGNDLIGVPGVALEVKFQERLNIHAAFEQASRAARPTETVVVAHKRNGGPLLATLELDELFALLKLREL